jgi:hypothetical protein
MQQKAIAKKENPQSHQSIVFPSPISPVDALESNTPGHYGEKKILSRVKIKAVPLIHTSRWGLRT